MALFRALSTRRSQGGGGYDKLLDETLAANDAVYSAEVDQAVLKRVTSVPASVLFGSSTKKLDFDVGYVGKYVKPMKQPQQQHHHQPSLQGKGEKGGKSHPVFSLFDGKWRKKKMTANPDFSRYVEYLKEGGMWNKDTNSPVIHYK